MLEVNSAVALSIMVVGFPLMFLLKCQYFLNGEFIVFTRFFLLDSLSLVDEAFNEFNG